MMWVPWLAGAVAAASTEQVLNRHLLSKHGQHWSYLLGYNFGALCLIGAFGLGASWSVEATVVPALAIAGLFWFLACYFSFRADEEAEVSETAPIGQIQPVLIFVGGILLLGEALTAAKVFGAALILVGVSLNGDGLRFTWSRGAAFKLVAVFFGALALLVDKWLTRSVSPELIAFAGYALPALIAAGLKPVEVRPALEFSRGIGFRNVALGALSGVGYLCLIKAMSMEDVSTVVPLFQIRLLITILLAHVALGERGGLLRKVLVSSVILAGSALVTW